MTHIAIRSQRRGEVSGRLRTAHRLTTRMVRAAVVALSLLPVFGPGTTLLRLGRLARLAHLLRHVSHLRLADLMLLRSRA